ncbi:MAG: 23S rRNA (cytidine(2498)-2'-O)-methyltransferase RlmM [Pseudomonadota bacterium]
MPPVAALLLYCRSGFEKEAAAEIRHLTAAAALSGFAKAQPDSAYVLFPFHQPLEDRDSTRLRFDNLIFARQLVFLLQSEPCRLPADDRITPLLARLRETGCVFREVRLETADTNAAKELSGFLRKFRPALESALRQGGLLEKGASRTLHLFFHDSTTLLAGFSEPGNASPWPLGIPRLKSPAGAPSRSTLKLEEALLYFLSAEERQELLREGGTAVDLGAAPGGWTWQLVKRGLQVTAIDNGAMDAGLMRGGQVEHLRSDGFRYRPPRSVDWLVCDMVEKPLRIAELCAGWIADGAARHAIFNLKLPMKKRHEEVQLCREAIARTLAKTPFTLRVKQLYHDREEVTAYLRRSGQRPR